MRTVIHTAVLCLLLGFPFVASLRLQGTWSSSDFFLFLAKFGFQKTNPQRLEETQGFIYGNITAKDLSVHREELTLVVVDSEYFVDFYGNRTRAPDKVCPMVFKKIDQIAFDYVCNKDGLEDFLRTVPCPKGQLCSDEDNPANVIRGYQFTYKVRDTQQPRFWYISLASCWRNRTGGVCKWVPQMAKEEITIEYDIWLVNGNPSSRGLNPFEHQFSFEFHDVFEIHLVAFLLCLLLMVLWSYAFYSQRHLITKLLTVIIGGELFSTMLNLIHVTVFAFNGQGVGWMSKVGTLVDVVVQCLFMMFLLLIAKGWAITTNELKWKFVLLGICGVYTVLNLFLYIWNLVEIDSIISNTDEWQTWPGYATLAFRLLVMVWFFMELRRTYHIINNDNLNFIQHFGAFFLVWFIYLPVLVAISTQISALWRYKTVLSINYAVDILAYAVMVHLFWPSRSVLFMVNGERPLPVYDLEITGLLEDIQETTIFLREKGKKTEGEEHIIDSEIHVNGNTVKDKGEGRNNEKNSAAAATNGVLNKGYRGDPSSDEDAT